MDQDKKVRTKNLRELYQTIKKCQYPDRMELDKALMMSALEKRIFVINGARHDIQAKSKI